jgi:hypothetical protein
MKTFSILTAAACLTASLAVALPAPAPPASPSTVGVKIKTGDGDASTIAEITLDVIFETTPQTNSGVSAEVDDDVFCQAFSDTAATKKLGPVFSNDSVASFTDASSGDVSSNAADAVPIGAIICSASQSGLQNDIAKASGGNKKTGSSTGSKPTTTTATPSASASTVGVKIKTGDGDASTIAEITLDVIFETTPQTNSGVSAEVDDDNVFCQAFSDVAATKKLGPVFSNNNDASFTNASSGDVDSNAADAVPIGAIICSGSQGGLQKDIAKVGGSSSGNDSNATVRIELDIDSETARQTEIALNKVVVTGIFFLCHLIRDLHES